MKRLLVLLGLLAVTLGAFAATANAKPAVWKLTLAADPTTVAYGGDVYFTAILTRDDAVKVNEDVTLVEYEGFGCETESGWSDLMIPYPEYGLYDGGFTDVDWVGEWSYRAFAGNIQSDCVDVTVASPVAPAAAPRTPNGIFLCYSKYQDQPGVWPEAQAKALLAEGYWYPYAVSGKVAEGTTIGEYHLTCNVAATQAVSGQVMGGDGAVLGAGYAGLLGYYPVVK